MPWRQLHWKGEPWRGLPWRDLLWKDQLVLHLLPAVFSREAERLVCVGHTALILHRGTQGLSPTPPEKTSSCSLGHFVSMWDQFPSTARTHYRQTHQAYYRRVSSASEQFSSHMNMLQQSGILHTHIHKDLVYLLSSSDSTINFICYLA